MGEPLQAGVLQFDVRRGDVAANLRAVQAGVARAAERGLRLLVLPEMWPTSFVDPRLDEGDWLPDTERALEVLRDLSRRHDMVLCGSAFGARPGGLPANRLHVLDRGELVLSYDKVHLFSPTAEGETLGAGSEAPRTVTTSVGRVSGVVCYDLRFGPLTRQPALDGAEILVVPAQWPTPRAEQWRALVIGRAVENQCHVVAANRTGRERVGRRELELEFPGNGLVVDPGGAVLAAGESAEGVVGAALDLEAARRLRIRVPVGKDRREALYGAWRAAREGPRRSASDE
jgi:predicted amidohydrolase